jgi:hypothetical protein
MKNIIKSLITKMFDLMGLVVRIRIKKYSPLRLWDENNEFNAVFKLVGDKTLLRKEATFVIYQYAKQVCSLDGDVAEVGVYKGGSAKIIAGVFNKSNKSIHLFDTFSGMPAVSLETDLHNQGDFMDTSLEEVKKFLQDFNNVFFYPGFFPDTSHPIKDKKFCFVSVDVDIYQSVKDCCDFFYSKVVKGGIIVFDDYGHHIACPGVKKAVDEFFRDKPEFPCYQTFTGQMVVIKL